MQSPLAVERGAWAIDIHNQQAPLRCLHTLHLPYVLPLVRSLPALSCIHLFLQTLLDRHQCLLHFGSTCSACHSFVIAFALIFVRIAQRGICFLFQHTTQEPDIITLENDENTSSSYSVRLVRRSLKFPLYFSYRRLQCFNDLQHSIIAIDQGQALVSSPRVH